MNEKETKEFQRYTWSRYKDFAARDTIIESLVGILLLLGLSEKEIVHAPTKLTGGPIKYGNKLMADYVRLAKEKMGMTDEVGEKTLQDVSLTVEGYREVRRFLKEASALRKELIDGMKDTANDTLPLNEGIVLSDAAYSIGTGGLDDEYSECFGVTDNESTKPICLQVGKHIIVKNPEVWPYSSQLRDYRGAIHGSLAVPSFTVGEQAILRTDGKRNKRVKIVACLLNSNLPLTKGQVGAWFSTDRGNIFVITEK